ncbi:unnamed protein product [Chondrus crispus]|uniref:Uncharacterized protein n=1 Tax=Chondrus crispus TaxID=2769 RepID=R7QUT8_CHOCR|nr:unnamed protein product [Chondrus crispus]CDF41246.1 unnamed protein product [Chondrus crispus]|eukprot:XP_005711540.1 unnamed protein product [Chondrus crispus]
MSIRRPSVKASTPYYRRHTPPPLSPPSRLPLRLPLPSTLRHHPRHHPRHHDARRLPPTPARLLDAAASSHARCRVSHAPRARHGLVHRRRRQSRHYNRRRTRRCFLPPAKQGSCRFCRRRHHHPRQSQQANRCRRRCRRRRCRRGIAHRRQPAQGHHGHPRAAGATGSPRRAASRRHSARRHHRLGRPDRRPLRRGRPRAREGAAAAQPGQRRRGPEPVHPGGSGRNAHVDETDGGRARVGRRRIVRPPRVRRHCHCGQERKGAVRRRAAAQRVCEYRVLCQGVCRRGE